MLKTCAYGWSTGNCYVGDGVKYWLSNNEWVGLLILG